MRLYQCKIIKTSPNLSAYVIVSCVSDVSA